MTPVPVDRLERPVDVVTDHVLGHEDADIMLVEYGSYDCPHSAGPPMSRLPKLVPCSVSACDTCAATGW